MKIISDRIQSGERHALSTSDIKMLISLLPDSCRNRIKTVHLSNQIFTNNTFDRPAIVDSFGRLTILSRGFEEVIIAQEILIELAQSGFLDPTPEHTIHWAVYANKLNQKDYRFHQDRIKPYLANYKKKSNKSEQATPRKPSD